MKSNIGSSNGELYTQYPGQEPKYQFSQKKFQNELEVLENIFHPINDYTKV